jgi:CBS domain-containing protein
MVKEFVDFLGGQPPYDALGGEDLERLVAHLEVEYFAAGSIVVAEGAERLDHMWVVRTGELEVVDRGHVVDVLGPGDTFGHVSVLSNLPPVVSVRAAEDSLCLRLPDPRTLLSQPERLRFTHLGTMVSQERLTRPGIMGRAGRPVSAVMQPIVWCVAADRVRDVARSVGAATHSCALIRAGDEIGIVTDRDFRQRVATGEVDLDAPIAELATIPVLAIEEDASQATGLLRMVEHGVHHLVVTGETGQPVGVVRVVDLASVEVRDPMLIRSAIDSAINLDALAAACRRLPATVVELRDSGVPALHVGGLVAAVVDAIFRRLIALRETPAMTEVAYSWVLLGSLARREPLPRSDVDTAIVWSDTPASPDPADAIRAAAEGVLQDMERCGLRRCPDGANAVNPLFSRSQSAWAEAATAWLDDPSRAGALLLSAMVTDSRPVTEVALGRSMTDVLQARTRTTQFLRAFLDEAVATKPPTGFVRDFVVHHSGEHRGEFDLKRGGLVPVVALGRWVAMVNGDLRGTTPERLRRGADAGLLTRDEADTLAGAFEDSYELLLEREVRAIRSDEPHTTFIAPRDLDTLTRRHLRESFRAIALVQGRIESDWAWRLAA